MRLAANFALIITGLCDALASRYATDRALQPIGLFILVRLCDAATQFQVLFVRWLQGRHTASRKRRQAAGACGRDEAVTKPGSSLPRGFAWLVKLLPEAAAYGSQLQQLLTDPQLARLLTEVPQAGRILRPICRMLGVQPLPQMRGTRAPKPGTTAPETVSPEKPPREPTPAPMPARMTATEKQRWLDENITIDLLRSLWGNPGRVKPVLP